MRDILAVEIKNAVSTLCVETNKILPCDLACRMQEMVEAETSQMGKAILRDLCANMEAAKKWNIPVCQDTGMAVIFCEIGQEVHIVGDFQEAVNAGVREGYLGGLLRCSVVSDPLERKNTGDNTPAILHISLVPGDKIAITVAPKGFGSENMSRLKMLTPSAGKQDIIDFVVETIKIAGGNPCPPMVLGVGIGGDFEYAPYLAKKALCRDISVRNPSAVYAALERDICSAVNETGIGPQGFGGKTTALAVNIEEYPTHIAGLPVAVNVGCHVTRHKKIII
ncbi:MAG: fumarate hydratase [Oscillospiraceae bacterium]